LREAGTADDPTRSLQKRAIIMILFFLNKCWTRLEAERRDLQGRLRKHTAASHGINHTHSAAEFIAACKAQTHENLAEVGSSEHQCLFFGQFSHVAPKVAIGHTRI